MIGTIITRILVNGRWTPITKTTRKALADAKGPRRYQVRWRAPGGRQKSKMFTKQKAAERFLTNTVKRVHEGSYVEVRPVPMGQVFTKWLEHAVEVRVKEGSLKASTARSYRSIVEEHLRPAFGAVRSDQLSGGAVEEWRKGLAEQVAAGALAPKSVTNTRNALGAVLRWARHPSRAYLAHDPLAGLERLRLPKGKRRPHFEPEQVAELLRLAALASPADTIIKTVVLSGVRRGELFAVKWSDVDWGDGRAGGRLHVRGTLDQGVVTRTKTEDSERAVDVPQALLDALAVHKVMSPPVGEGFIFRDAEGRPLDPDAWHKKRLVPLLERAGLRLPQTGLHSLRHSYVSILGAAGADLRYIADQVGHSTTRLTQDLYTHVLTRARHEAMRRLDDVGLLWGAEGRRPFNGDSTEPAGTPRTAGDSKEDANGERLDRMESYD